MDYSMIDIDNIKRDITDLKSLVNNLIIKIDSISSIANDTSDVLEREVLGGGGSTRYIKDSNPFKKKNYAESPYTVFCDQEESDDGNMYIYVPKGCLRVDGEAVSLDADYEVVEGLSADESDGVKESVYAHVRVVVKNGVNDVQTKFTVDKDYDGWEWEPGERRYDFLVGVFAETYTRLCESMVEFDERKPPVAFEVVGRNGNWHVRYLPGCFSYSGFTPAKVEPVPDNDGWVRLDSKGKSLSISAIASLEIKEVDVDGKIEKKVVGCSKLKFSIGGDTSEGSSSEGSSDEGSSEGNFRFAVADIKDGVVKQVALGAIHIGSNSVAPLSETPNDGVLTIRDADGNTIGTFSANQYDNTEIDIPVGQTPNDGKLTINVGGAEAGYFTADQSNDTVINLPEVKDGTLSIKSSDGKVIGEFSANQESDVDITLPAPSIPEVETPNDGVLTIKDSKGNTIGTFSANQKNDVEVNLPVAESGGGGGETYGASGSITVVCDTQYDKYSHQLQQKTQIITIEDGLVKDIGEISDWGMIVGGQAKPVG